MRALVIAAILAFSTTGLAQENPVVIMETSMGTIKIELWADKAPISVENFLRYTDEGLYDSLIFHRVIPGFMVQGGGFSPDMIQLSSYEPIKNEARVDVPNTRGTLAMARTSGEASPRQALALVASSVHPLLPMAMRTLRRK